MNRLIPLLALASLAACSPATEAEPADAPAEAAAPAAPTTLGGVDLSQPLRAAGSEPFWTADIADGVLTWRDMDDFAGDIATVRTGTVTATPSRAGVAYAATLTDGSSVTLTLTAGPCPDIGEETRALNASLERAGTIQTACADLRSAYPAEAVAG